MYINVGTFHVTTYFNNYNKKRIGMDVVAT